MNYGHIGHSYLLDRSLPHGQFDHSGGYSRLDHVPSLRASHETSTTIAVFAGQVAVNRWLKFFNFLLPNLMAHFPSAYWLALERLREVKE